MGRRDHGRRVVSTVEDRITTIVTEHTMVRKGACFWCRKCQSYVGKWEDERDRHLAQAIAESNHLTVIARPSVDDLASAIAGALCAQEEAADSAGDQSWWGMSTDDVADIAARGAAKLLGIEGDP